MRTGAVLRASYAYGNYIDEVVEALRDTDNDLVVDDPLYYHQDDLFSVYAVTDATGAVVERYDFSDYGEMTVQRPDGNVKPETYWIGNRHTFTGRLVEWDTGLLQYRHRYMAPVLGRFVQRDPLGTWFDEANFGAAVAYAGSSPLVAVDPTGETSLFGCSKAPWACAPAFGAGAGGGLGGSSGGAIGGGLSWGARGVAGAGRSQQAWGIFCAAAPKTAVAGAGIVAVRQILKNSGPQRMPRVRVHRCTAKCALRGSDPRCQGYHVGPPATGASQSAACKLAKRLALSATPDGCFAGHCRCICAGR